MLDKFSKILFSTRLTAILFIVFAVTMATGTFMDAGQDMSPTPYTRNLIYNTWWFETIMVFFVINFCGNIFRYRLYKKEKWATLTLHLAFIFILVGAAITRYVSFEGMMPIREGATENTFLSQKTYITTQIYGDYKVNDKIQMKVLEDVVDFSGRLDNNFKIETDYNKQPVTIELEKFIIGAEEDIVPDENGEEYLKLVEAGTNGPHNHFLKVGQQANIHNVIFTLNNPAKGAINLFYKGDSLSIDSPFDGEYMTMATRAQGKLVKDSLQMLNLRSRYIIGNMQLVFPKPVVKGVFDIVKKSTLLKNSEDGVVLKVTANGETQQVGLLGGPYINNPVKRLKVGGLEFDFKYGAKVLQLPFSIKLNDFVAGRYPGTEKRFSDFSSQVTVIDTQEEDFDYKIFMNNILDHRGYRFFQSNFDPDEKGTILSVNHDYWGSLITYIGYFLLYFGLMAILFSKHTRFGDLKRNLQKVKSKKEKLLSIIILCFGLNSFSQSHDHTHSNNNDHTHDTPREKPSKTLIDSILKKNIVPEAHASEFGHLVIQDLSGRMMPVNTYASEILRKISKSDTYEGLDANQVFLSIQEYPQLWYNVPVIYLRPMETDSLRTIIGVSKKGKHFAFTDFINDDGSYKLSPYLEEAYSADIPNGYQKKIKETDQRVNLLFNNIKGESLKIFPIPNDENNKWVSSYDYKLGNYKVKDSLYNNFIENGFKTYLYALSQAKQSGNFTEASKLLRAFKKTQHMHGAEVMLSDEKVKTEILYNKYDVFKKLYKWYMYTGALFFILLIVQIFKDKSKLLNIGVGVFKWIVVGLFLIHTAGLIVRWYISGHAPWSDAYESMIYVAWSTMLFGLITGISKGKKKKEPSHDRDSLGYIITSFVIPAFGFFKAKSSNLTIAAGAFVTSMTRIK